MSKLWEIKISALLGWYSWNCPTAVGCFGCADAAPAWGTLWVPQILDCSRTCAYKRPRTFAYNRPKMWVNFGLIQLTLPKCCWVLWLSWCCTSLGNIVGMTDELNFNLEVYFFLSIIFWPQSALKHSFLGAESSNFAMNGPKNLSESLCQKGEPFWVIWNFLMKKCPKTFIFECRELIFSYEVP